MPGDVELPAGGAVVPDNALPPELEPADEVFPTDGFEVPDDVPPFVDAPAAVVLLVGGVVTGETPLDGAGFVAGEFPFDDVSPADVETLDGGVATGVDVSLVGAGLLDGAVPTAVCCVGVKSSNAIGVYKPPPLAIRRENTACCRAI